MPLGYALWLHMAGQGSDLTLETRDYDCVITLDTRGAICHWGTPCGCIWLGKEMVPFARAVFEIYWGEDKDISQDAVLAEICKRVGVDPVKFFEGISQQAIKDQLKANTDEVMARGGFGSPTIFIDKTDMYFGNDRMPLIREALLRRKASAA